MDSNIVRRAGLLERFYITRCALGFDSVIAFCARYSASHNSRTVLDRTTVIRALKLTLAELPALCVQISRTDSSKKGPNFVRLAEINLNDVVQTITDEQMSLEDIMQSELSKPIPHHATVPLWRIAIRCDTLIFSYHHAIGDGLSGLAFHQTFCSALNKMSIPGSAPDGSPMATTPTSIVMPPPAETLTKMSLTVLGLMRAVYKTFAPIACQRLHTAWTGNAVAKAPHVETGIRLHRIQPDKAQILLGLCQKNQCTLTSFLHTLAVLILSRVLEERGNSSNFKSFSTIVPVSLRPLTGTPALAMCNDTTFHYAYPAIRKSKTLVYPPTKETFCWGAAAEFKRELHGSILKDRQVIGTIKFMYKLGISTAYFLGGLGQKRLESFVISNLGRFVPLPSQDSDIRPARATWTIEDVCFGQCDAVIGAAVKLNVAGTPSGAVNIAYTWGKGAIDEDVLQAFIDGMKESMLCIAAD